MKCPQCNGRIIQKSGKVTRLRTDGPVTFDEDGNCNSKCYWCKAPVMLPLRLSAEEEVPEERFIIQAKNSTA